LSQSDRFSGVLSGKFPHRKKADFPFSGVPSRERTSKACSHSAPYVRQGISLRKFQVGATLTFSRT
jgi:hypothetical protein